MREEIIYILVKDFVLLNSIPIDSVFIVEIFKGSGKISWD
jgi:hypothetical protein